MTGKRQAIEPGDRVTIKGERDVYGDGTVVSVEGNCVNVKWDSDGHIGWSFAEDIEQLTDAGQPALLTTPADPDRTVPPVPAEDGVSASDVEGKSQRAREALAQQYDAQVTALGEALFMLSGLLRMSGFLKDEANHAAYEKVVSAFQGIGK